MGRGTSGAVTAPAHDGAGSPADSDQKLVARVRRGDDRAFELLYQRYHRRIHAYVLGMVKDHGRAEDVTQEVFVSALRRMRETEQPLAFKPWLYQIAKNSCIDAFRRSKRAEEVSYDADDAPRARRPLASWSAPARRPTPRSRPSRTSTASAARSAGCPRPTTRSSSCASSRASPTRRSASRMGMSRPAVESTLFRARRRLTEEYDDIVSGARCQRIQGIIVTAVADAARHARHAPARAPPLALPAAAGARRWPPGWTAACSRARRVRERVAAQGRRLPAVPDLREAAPRRATPTRPPPPPSGRGAAFDAHLPMFSDQLASGWGKAAAGAAVLVAGAKVLASTTS